MIRVNEGKTRTASSLTNHSLGTRKPLVQKGFLEDSISSSNLTILNNRNYNVRNDQMPFRDHNLASGMMINGSFNGSTCQIQYPQQENDNILSESAEDLFNYFRQLKAAGMFKNIKLNSIGCGNQIMPTN